MNATIPEIAVPGPDVPQYEIPEWRGRFGVVAGITARGSATAPFDLGLNGQAPVGETMARWRLFRESHPEFPAQVIAHQVHGSRILWHDSVAPGWSLHDTADGHATQSRGLLLLVTVADCVPIYLLAPSAGAIALLHSGWRGTASGILARGVALLRERVGVQPRDLVMHVGVAISGPRYEVGAEVMAGVGIAPMGSGPWHLDLRSLLLRQGTELGIGEISTSPHCTAEPEGPFFSHRASGGTDGRMVAWLGILPGG